MSQCWRLSYFFFVIIIFKKRDAHIIFSKLRIVFFANTANPEIRKDMEERTLIFHRQFLADIWGPLLISIGIAMFMQPISFSNESALVLIFQWVGAILLTMNCKLLGYNMFACFLCSPFSSYFQMFSHLGYSSFPILLHSFVHWLIPFSLLNLIISLFVSVWCLRSSHLLSPSSLAISAFLSRYIDNRRRVLVLFPCLLYFFIIGNANI